MRKRIIKYGLIAAVIFGATLSSHAQHSLQLYNFNNVAQSTLLNPATHVQSNFTFGVYGGGNLFAPNLNLADIFLANEPANAVISRLASSPDKLSRISAEAQAGIFIGFRLKRKNYISLGAYISGYAQASIPTDLIKLASSGSTPYVGNTLAIAPLIFGTTSLNYHIGYAREFANGLSVGGRVKLISGIQNISTYNRHLSLSIGEDPLTKYAYFLSADYDLRFNNRDIIFGDNKNPDFSSLLFANGINGFGIDLGLEYKINDKWSFSLSVLDIGTINWNGNVGRLQKRGVNEPFNGIISPSLSALDLAGFVSNRLDSIGDKFNFDTTYNGYQAGANGKFYAGVEYQIRPTTKVGATMYGGFGPLFFDYALGVSISQKLWSILDLRLGWNLYNATAANIGAGISINLGYFQIYASTENILSAFRYDQAHFFNAHIGVNINLGLNLDKDKDGVPNRKDKCVSIPGLEKFDGCPDTDRDGVPDNKDSCRLDSGAIQNKGCPLKLDRDGDSVLDVNDSCPDVKGLASAFGCPDADGDSIPDYKDSCVNVPGPAFANGCPDADGDGIPDYRDSCKYLAGKAEFYGCPTLEKLIASRYDKDGDETPDSVDRCPDLPGEPLLYGCPDYDKDGVPDYQDSCIELPGELEFNGCPDTDGDKVPDYIDECITLAGSKENGGCPASVGNKRLISSRTQGDDQNALRNTPLDVAQSKVLVEAFKNLQFRFQSASILETSYTVLDDLADLLKSKPNAGVVLVGHTDNIGDELFNQVLSYRRAVSVRDYLREKGVTNKIEVFGFGENRPIADNISSQGRARNRRVEIGILSGE